MHSGGDRGIDFVATQFLIENRRWCYGWDLMLLGGYQAGQDPELDMAFQLYPNLVNFISQSTQERSGLLESEARLQSVIG